MGFYNMENHSTKGNLFNVEKQINNEGSTTNNINNQNNYTFHKEKVINFHEKDIKDIIIYFSNQIDNISIIKNEEDADFINIPLLKTKNKLNKLSNEYFEELKDNHMGYFYKIDTFLKDPKNKKYLRMYKNTTSEIKYKIIATRKDYPSFESILMDLYDCTLNKNLEELPLDRDFIFVFLHFMYCNCDIGIKCDKERGKRNDA